MSEEKYWYNLATGEIEHGRQSSWENRMGPYDSREEAQAALTRAQRRNDSWDAEDHEWKS